MLATDGRSAASEQYDDVGGQISIDQQCISSLHQIYNRAYLRLWLVGNDKRGILSTAGPRIPPLDDPVHVF
jgi:hypothetical protein